MMNLGTRPRARGAGGRPAVVPGGAGHQHPVDPLLRGLDAHQRAVAQLQQQITVLKAEVGRLKADQILAELDYTEDLAAGSRRSAFRSDYGIDRGRSPVAVKTTSPVHDSPGGDACSGNLSSRCPAASPTRIEVTRLGTQRRPLPNHDATWVRFETPSFMRMCWTWFWAVREEMWSSAAMALLLSPRATRPATSNSLSERGPELRAGAPAVRRPRRATHGCIPQASAAGR